MAFTSKLLNLSDDAAPSVGLALRLAYTIAVGRDKSRVHEAQRGGRDRVVDARAKYLLAGGGPAAVGAARTEIRNGASGAIVRAIDVPVCNGNVQRAIGVLCTYVFRAVDREARRVAEGVCAAEREAGVVDAAVLDRVVETEGVVCVVVVLRMREHRAAPVAIGRQRSQIVNDGIVLAAERKHPELRAGHTDEGLTAELLALLPQLAAINVKAVFQLEERCETAPQVFLAFQAPTGTLGVAA